MAEIDKVKLEQLIDKYLQEEIPLSFLMEEYKLTFPQMKLLINRTISYTKKTDYLYDNYPSSSYDNPPQEYIAIPHELEEQYPFSHDEQMALFKRLEELMENIPVASKDILVAIEEEIKRCQEALQAINLEDIVRAEKIAKEIEHMQENDDDFEDIFRRNFISPSDFQRLNTVYCEYLELRNRYSNLCSKKVESEADLKTAKRLSREIEDIRSDLVIHNMKLVNFCTRYFFSGIPLPQDDVQLYGVEGLVKAINGFDHKLGFHFSTYAVPVIVHTIERHFKEMTGMYWRDYCRKDFIRRYRDLYKKELELDDYKVSARTLAESGLVPLTEQEIMNSDKMIDGVAPLTDIQTPFDDEEEFGMRDYPSTFDDYSKVDSYSDSYEGHDDGIEREVVGRFINSSIMEVVMSLPVRNAEVLIARYGLDGSGGKSLRQLAKIYNVTPERIRQIEAKGIRLLRHPSRLKKIKGFLEYFDEDPNGLNIDSIPPVLGTKRF